jgi:hypothetical protein
MRGDLPPTSLCSRVFPNQAANRYVVFEVFTLVTMKNALFLGYDAVGSCQNRCFGGTCHLYLQDRKSELASVSNIRMETRPFITSVLTRSTRRSIPEDDILPRANISYFTNKRKSRCVGVVVQGHLFFRTHSSN